MSQAVYFHFHHIAILQPLYFIIGIVEESRSIKLEETTGAYSAAAYNIAGQNIYPVCAALYYFGKGPVHIAHIAFAHGFAIYRATHFQIVAVAGMVWLCRYLVWF